MHPELAAEEKIIFCLFLNEHSNLSRDKKMIGFCYCEFLSFMPYYLFDYMDALLTFQKENSTPTGENILKKCQEDQPYQNLSKNWRRYTMNPKDQLLA